ncbi:MAG: hypothetical protein ACOCWI_03905 [Bacillota bacterium]
MQKSKKALIGQILSIVQWIILLALGILIAPWWGWMFALGLFIIHSFEALWWGIPRGKLFGYTFMESLCLTWIYGFTWWKYLTRKRQ